MKLARLYGARDLRIEEMEAPSPGPGEALVRIDAVGICGSDVHYFTDGRIGDAVVRSPLILGHEFAGTVEEVGEDVLEVEPGVRVAVEPGVPCGACEPCRAGKYNLCSKIRFCGTPPVDGAYRELIAYPVHYLYPLPARVSSEEGAMIETLAVGVHAADLGRIKVANTVAVIGTGSVGLLMVQLARISGASEVYAVDLLPERLEAAKRLGADAAILAGDEDPVEAILRLTGGRGVDVAFEAAGAAETPGQCTEIAKQGGAVVLIGIPRGDEIPLRAGVARRKGLTILMARRMKHTYRRAITLVERDMVDVKCLITHRFPLEEIIPAFEMVAQYADGVIKALITKLT